MPFTANGLGIYTTSDTLTGDAAIAINATFLRLTTLINDINSSMSGLSYLPLAGGTLTGTLIVPSLQFSTDEGDFYLRGDPDYGVGGVGFYNNDSGNYGLFLQDTGTATITTTQNNVLDDGNGNLTIASNLTISGALQSDGYAFTSDGSGNVSAQSLTLSQGDVTAEGSSALSLTGNGITLYSYSGVQTANNVLDDGGGNLSIAGCLYLTGNYNIFFPTGGCVKDDGGGGVSLCDDNGSSLSWNTNDTLYQLIIPGSMSVEGAISAVGGAVYLNYSNSANQFGVNCAPSGYGKFCINNSSGSGAAQMILNDNGSYLYLGGITAGGLKIGLGSSCYVAAQGGNTLDDGSHNFTVTGNSAVGTVTSGTWHGSVVGSTYGGTGINNGSSTLTLAGSLSTSGAYTVALTATAATSITLPTTGILATTNSTTAFTAGVITAAGYNGTLSTKTSAYTLTATDSTILVNSASNITMTLPTAASIAGREYVIKTINSAATVGTTSSQTIDGSTTYSLSANHKYVAVVSDGSNWQIVANN